MKNSFVVPHHIAKTLFGYQSIIEERVRPVKILKPIEGSKMEIIIRELPKLKDEIIKLRK